MRVCLEERKACETDATQCVCLLSPFKSYITNFFHTENCIYPLGLESGEITDEALTDSVDTTLTVSDPSGIRLNKNPGGFPNGWQAATGTLDYIQVENILSKLSNLVLLMIIPTRLLCEMYANSSEAEFLGTPSKFRKRKKISSGLFTSSI